jgi:hypothetical protein
MHASRKLTRLTTAVILMLLSACGSTAATGSDAGCSTQACTQSPNCPAITCTCTTGIGVLDAGGSQTGTRTITGECTSGCCAGCPAGCT